MNKKQAGIIVTLLALIVCAAVIAAKVNMGNPLDAITNGTVSQEKDSDDFFLTSKIARENEVATVLSNLLTIIEDKNISQAQRDEAASKHIMIATAKDQENQIEQALKSKGFEDVICTVENENTKVRVVVKAKELSEEQVVQIQDVAMGVSKFRDLEIQPRQ